MLKQLLAKFKTKKSHANIGVIAKEYFEHFLPSEPIIVDAGAANGIDSVEMAKLWKKSSIHAFEPIPQLFAQIIENIKPYDNIILYSVALSDFTGSSEMFVSSGTSKFSSSLLTPKEHLTEHPEVSFDTKIEVETITLDRWAKDNNVDRIDLLWLDLQGSEPAVLKASPKILKTVKAIYTEVSLKELYRSTPLYPEFRQWLETQGFRVEREELAWEDAGNVLFVRK